MLAVPDHLLHQPFRGADAVARGLLTPRQLRGASWRQLFPGVYVHEDVDVTHALRAIAAGALVLPDAVVTGASAAALWDVPLAGPDDDVELTRWPGEHPVRVAGLRVRRADMEERTVVRRRGVLVTTPEATAVRVAGALPPDAAVAAVDQLVHIARADLDEVRWLARIADGPNRRRAQTACALADGLAESPKETGLRLLLHRSPLPRPVAQHSVRQHGRFVARVDFGWPAQRLAVEYDGLWHRDPRQFIDDRQRLNRLTAAGWRVLFVTTADLARPGQVIARLSAALAVVR